MRLHTFDCVMCCGKEPMEAILLAPRYGIQVQWHDVHARMASNMLLFFCRGRDDIDDESPSFKVESQRSSQG